MRFPIWKWRNHPIKRDKRGRPLRQQAFELFDKKLRPSQIYKQQLLPAKLKTLLRYYEDWKKLPQHLELHYRMIRVVRKSIRKFSEPTIGSLGAHLGMFSSAMSYKLTISISNFYLKPFKLGQSR